MKPIVLTYGMGIGPEVAQKALKSLALRRPVVLSGRQHPIFANVPTISKLTDASNHRVSYWKGYVNSAEPPEVSSVRWAVEQCLLEHAAALVTGPINKAQLADQGFQFKGHTDFISSLCGVKAIMGFVGAGFHVALVTHHIPLMNVSAALSREAIHRTVHIVQRELQDRLAIQSPKIVLCGLNPHAGEEGLLGSEEQEIIIPAADQLRKQGYDVCGPISAETAFVGMVRKEFDVLVAMYHDQALVPLKALAFGRTVNWSMGLPIVRCSVDHGTADDLVGTSRANPNSMLEALRLAEHLSNESDKFFDVGLLKPA